jgi:hypothetical protein
MASSGYHLIFHGYPTDLSPDGKSWATVIDTVRFSSSCGTEFHVWENALFPISPWPCSLPTTVRIMAYGKKATPPIWWRRIVSFECFREKQLIALRVAVLVLLAMQALILHRCYYACCANTQDRLQQQVYSAFTAHNSSQRVPQRFSQQESEKGPFRTWKDARQALHSVRQRDIQLEIGAPLNSMYLHFREEGVRLDHLPPPPTQCRRFYDDDSPMEIDLALVRMLGRSSSKIPTEFVRHVRHAVDLTTNYRTRFPLDKSVTIYVLKTGKLYFDRRSNHPRSCGHQHKIVGFMSFMREVAARLGQPGFPDVAFRFSCLDNPYSPVQGLWTYSSFKDGRGGPLAFPDDYFTFERWRRLRPNPSEVAYRSKPPRAAWFGGKTGDVPLHHADRQGYLDLDSVEMIETMTSREYFVSQYAPGNDARIVAAFDKIPMSDLLARYRVLLAIAGHSFASNTLPLLSSNSLVVQQVSGWLRVG